MGLLDGKVAIVTGTVIFSLELGRYGVRANAIAPGGMTRFVGVHMPDADIKEPDQ